MLSISSSCFVFLVLCQPAPTGSDPGKNPTPASPTSATVPLDASTKSPAPTATPDVKPAPGTKVTPGTQATPGAKADAKTLPDTPATRFVRDAAQRLAKHKYLFAEFTLSLRERDRTIRTQAIIKIAPKNRFWLEIKTTDSNARRLFASDGVLGYRHRKIFDQESSTVFQMNELVPVIRELGLPPEVLRTVLVIEGLPRLDPADMLNGYLETVHFDILNPGKQEGKRKVTIVEGKWKPEQITRFKNAQASLGLPTEEENFPSHVRLFFDEQTSWPVTITMFIKNKLAEHHPMFKVEFSRLELDKEIPDKEFSFTPPTAPADETSELIIRLKTHAQNYLRSTAATAATAKPAPPAPTAPPPPVKP